MITRNTRTGNIGAASELPVAIEMSEFPWLRAGVSLTVDGAPVFAIVDDNVRPV